MHMYMHVYKHVFIHSNHTRITTVTVLHWRNVLIKCLHSAGEPKRAKYGAKRSTKGEVGGLAPIEHKGMAAFQQPKVDRENFRKALVDIVM